MIQNLKKILEQFDWMDPLFTEAKKQAVEDILVENYDIFVRHKKIQGDEQGV